MQHAITFNYSGQVVSRLIKIIIDNQIVKFNIMRHFTDRFMHTFINDRFIILGTRIEAFSQFGGRWRNDIYRYTVRHQLSYLPSALPVYFQYNIHAFEQLFLNMLS